VVSEFDYFTAFRRNLGFLDRNEQTKISNSRVAIAGLGGTGGAQAHALARLGIGGFTLADLDIFEVVNFNRQLGATMDTVGKAKVDVVADIVSSINPEADVRKLPEGITGDTIGTFLKDVDVVVDSLDFYCFKERFLLYRNARERGIWVFTAPPLGFGYTLLAFDPKGMSFPEYFDFNEEMPLADLAISLIAGIAPVPYMFRYLHRGGIDVEQHQLPSVGAAPFMIAGVIATEVANLLTGKYPVIAVPTVQQFDALLHRYRRHRYPFGMRGPIQRIKKALLRRRVPV
jgi:molybdopterin/thiamine biosynthesis adenylyltransferase